MEFLVGMKQENQGVLVRKGNLRQWTRRNLFDFYLPCDCSYVQLNSTIHYGFLLQRFDFVSWWWHYSKVQIHVGNKNSFEFKAICTQIIEIKQRYV